MKAGCSYLNKRRSSLISGANSPVTKGASFSLDQEVSSHKMKKRESSPESYVESPTRKPEDDFTIDNGDKDEENEENEENGEEEGVGDDDEAEELTFGDIFDKDSAGRCFSHGYHLVQGKMDHGMEDYIVAKTKELKNSCRLGLYGIFDGHSGCDVAKYLQRYLFDNILNEDVFWNDPVQAVKKAYGTTDDKILENVVGSRGGSTAVTGILVNGTKLIMANVGDSRAVLCKKGVAQQISVDHEPEKEKDLVESRGGFVVKYPGNIPRVDGTLAMTRAFGDGKLKDHITSEPDVGVIKIDEDTDFIIFASDGLWKVMSNQEACDCIRDKDDAKEAAQELINEALSLKSCDDISCIVVKF